MNNDNNQNTRLLISKGAVVYVKNSKGRTALNCAVEKNDKNISELLGLHGAKE